ncbi:MAG: glycosyltransferase family 4 protein [Verrucomicrobiota bacterium]|nr:glycosyltransferase family 4 protein [Verrucomicrobiota bacterium]
MNRNRLVYIVNVDWFFISHRLPLACAALEDGWDVWIFTTDTGRVDELASRGFHIRKIPLGRAMQNPFLELYCFLSIFWGLLTLRPAVVHCVAFKAVVFGGLAARLCRIPRMILAVTGFGSTFLTTTWKTRLWRKAVFSLMQFICASPGAKVILQNRDDVAEFISAQIATPAQIALIRGSGVDIDEFIFSPEPDMAGGFVCTLPARLLRDKGIYEFVEAAKILRASGKIPGLKMVLAGGIDPHNRSSISGDELDEWVGSGLIEWIDHQKDMVRVYHQCHVVVLPSYREGLPKVLIEAGACGRVSVTTDVPGCREIISHGVNGLIVPAKDGSSIAQAIETLFSDAPFRLQMCRRAREMVVDGYDIRQVISKTLSLYR